MSVEQLAAWSQVVASVAVVISLVFVAWEMRMSTKVASATARHNLSQFAADISQFNAEHADRIAKVHASGVLAKDLTPGDLVFRSWNHVHSILHAETFYRHNQLGLMPRSHWDGYCNFFSSYVATPGFADTWAQMGPAFSSDFGAWVETHLAKTAKPIAAEAVPAAAG